MNGWMDGRKDGWMDGLMDEWMDEWTDGWYLLWFGSDSLPLVVQSLLPLQVLFQFVEESQCWH